MPNGVNDAMNGYSSLRVRQSGIDEIEDKGFHIKKKTLACVGVITSLYVVVEIAMALYPRLESKDGVISLSLLSDGFHNLSDVLSVLIAYWTLDKSRMLPSDRMTFGWRRSEVVGVLINTSCLLSLCFYIFLDSIPRLVIPEPLRPSVYYLVVCGVGVLVNMVAAVIFWYTSTMHLVHSHHYDKVFLDRVYEQDEILGVGDEIDGSLPVGVNGIDHKMNYSIFPNYEDFGDDGSFSKMMASQHDHDHGHHGHHGHHDHHDMNIRSVFIHFLGDAISSILVFVCGLIVYFTGKHPWLDYLDPISSLIIVVIVLYSAIPLVKQCAFIVLQQVPSYINLSIIRKNLLQIPGVTSVHDLHVWLLVDGILIASVHLGVTNIDLWNSVKSRVKTLFHFYSIHSSTIQPEFGHVETSKTRGCPENCTPECIEDWCCKKLNTNILNTYTQDVQY